VLLCFNHGINTQVQLRSTKHTLNPFIESSSYPNPFLFLTCATKYFHTKHIELTIPEQNTSTAKKFFMNHLL